jgi:hypothetical protein
MRPTTREVTHYVALDYRWNPFRSAANRALIREVESLLLRAGAVMLERTDAHYPSHFKRPVFKRRAGR